MFSKSSFLLLATALMAAPIASTMAQQNNPTGNLGSNRSATAAPGTADTKAAPGMNTADVGANKTPRGNYSGSPMNPTKSNPSAAYAPGSNSNNANMSKATRNTQTGTVTPSGGGGGR